jgi:hypothetical protein
MYNKTFWLGYVAVFVVAQVLGFLVHEVMLDATYQSLAHVFRPQEEMMNMMWLMFVGSAAYLFVFCLIFTKGYERRGIGEGLRYGALVGLLMSIPMSVDQYVVYPVPANLALMWFVTGVVSFMIIGAVFAAIYKPDA